jgi:hypothetical protein
MVVEARKEKNLSPVLLEIINRLEKIVQPDKVRIPPVYDPNFGDEKLCVCTHSYYRHFDTYTGMFPIGCKYCPCQTFELKV